MSPQGPTLAQLQADLAAINAALADPVLRCHYPDGRDVTFRSTQELLLAKADKEDEIRCFGGARASKSTLAEHRRGDGPYGPGFPGPPGWGWW
jgi:hypothetical protein